jgi:hypothetical protein
MNSKQRSVVRSWGFVLILICVSAAHAESVENLKVLKISPQDERAVIRTADGKTQVVKPGEVLDATIFTVPGSQFAGNDNKQPTAVSVLKNNTSDQHSAIGFQQNQEKNDTTLTVIEIAEGRVVLEEQKGNDKETVIIRLKNGKQTVERMRRVPPKRTLQ